MLPDSSKLAKEYFLGAASEIDSLPLPKPLPMALLFQDGDLRRKIAEIGDQYYRDGDACPATFILAAKKQYSFRMHARLTLASQIAFELSAREFAMASDKAWAPASYSFVFDKTLPKRLYPETGPHKRDRWLRFEHRRVELIKQLGPAEQGRLSGLTTDLSRYFDNVRRPKLLKEMEQWFPKMKGRVQSFGNILDVIMDGRDGLPQSSQSGFFFGDLFLLNCDKVAGEKAQHFLRWADEYWWFDKYPSTVEASFRATLASISELGLVFNDSKSKHVDREEELRERAEFQLVREIYYGSLGKSDTAAKCGFICGMIIERASGEKSQTPLDKFLLNRLRELFATDREGAKVTQKLVLRGFTQSYKRSKDALGQWGEILLMLPDRTAVFEEAWAAFKTGKYPLDSDRARLLDLMAVPEFATASESTIKSSQLEKIARNHKNCPTLRGSSLRALFCRNKDIGLAIDIAKTTDSRLMREYIAATGVLSQCKDCKKVIAELRKSQIDAEEGILLTAYERLCHCEEDVEPHPLRFLPSDPFILTKQLELAVRRKY